MSDTPAVCGTCKHYNPEKEYLEVHANPGFCGRIPDFNDAPIWWPWSKTGDDDTEVERWWEKNKAASYDYEGYSSGFYCAPDFGCVLHEPKEANDE